MKKVILSSLAITLASFGISAFFVYRSLVTDELYMMSSSAEPELLSYVLSTIAAGWVFLTCIIVGAVAVKFGWKKAALALSIILLVTVGAAMYKNSQPDTWSEKTEMGNY